MTTEVLRAFHDSQELKDHYLQRVRAHAAADRLIQGTGWENGRGCAVGCTLESYDHSRYPVELGIPRVLAHLEDRLFERLPKSEAMTWPERFLSVIQPGADLSMVWPRFAVWLLDVELAKWRTFASDAVVRLYNRRIAGDEPSDQEWYQARAAADAAAASYASYAAAAYASYSAAAYAAYSSAAAYAASAYAAYAASDASDAASAYSAYASYSAADASIKRQSEKLLQLLSEA